MTQPLQTSSSSTALLHIVIFVFHFNLLFGQFCTKYLLWTQCSDSKLIRLVCSVLLLVYNYCTQCFCCSNLWHLAPLAFYIYIYLLLLIISPFSFLESHGVQDAALVSTFSRLLCFPPWLLCLTSLLKTVISLLCPPFVSITLALTPPISVGLFQNQKYFFLEL